MCPKPVVLGQSPEPEELRLKRSQGTPRDVETLGRRTGTAGGRVGLSVGGSVQAPRDKDCLRTAASGVCLAKGDAEDMLDVLEGQEPAAKVQRTSQG